MIPTALKVDQNNIEQYKSNIMNCMNSTLTAYYDGFLPAELHGLQGGTSRESPVPYGVDRPEVVRCA